MQHKMSIPEMYNYMSFFDDEIVDEIETLTHESI